MSYLNFFKKVTQQKQIKYLMDMVFIIYQIKSKNIMESLVPSVYLSKKKIGFYSTLTYRIFPQLIFFFVFYYYFSSSRNRTLASSRAKNGRFRIHEMGARNTKS